MSIRNGKLLSALPDSYGSNKNLVSCITSYDRWHYLRILAYVLKVDQVCTNQQSVLEALFVRLFIFMVLCD